MTMTTPSNAFSTATILFEEAKASQSDGDGFFKLSLFECESVSDGNVIDRHESTMSASATRLSTSMME
jgi:hypothetical protein